MLISGKIGGVYGGEEKEGQQAEDNNGYDNKINLFHIGYFDDDVFVESVQKYANFECLRQNCFSAIANMVPS